jgi:hypothetical protein
MDSIVQKLKKKMCLCKLWCKRADTNAPSVIYEFVLIIPEKYHTQLLFMPILIGMLFCGDFTEVRERSLLLKIIKWKIFGSRVHEVGRSPTKFS